MPWWRWKVSTTCSPSPWRMSPVSTNTQVSWGPMALCTSAAATAESTPPDRPQMARPVADLGPDGVDRGLDDRAHRPRRLAAARRRRGSARASPGRAACARPRGGTARRRCRRSTSSKAATGASAVEAVTVNPSGALGDGVEVAHPHLLVRRAGRRRTARRRRRRRRARCGRTRPGRCGPPRRRARRASELGAVADAEDRDAEVVDGRVDARGALDVDRLRAAAEDDAGRARRAASRPR